ncbi:MAG TPA: cbb3-type cytochrome c oxidase subunit I [Terriglobales bacterium]|nr:cbb3-type cytochrome c oxidase subunit I [Terriglobales bacterium]
MAYYPGRLEVNTYPVQTSDSTSRLSRIFSRSHQVIGKQYFFLSLFSVLVGMVLSLVMRLHIIWPGLRIPWIGEIRPETYLAFMTMHGTLMIFFVLSTAPQNAFGNLVLPAQLGAKRMAFPWMNMLSFWTAALSLAVMLAALVVGGGPQSGWTHYPPLSALPAAGPGQGLGMDLWLVSIGIFCVSSLLSAVNVMATTLRMRAPGMSLMRMPLTAWAWFVTAQLTLLAFSVLLAAGTLLFADRHFGTSFYVPGGLVVSGAVVSHTGGSPLLWQHLFWFFGHPEVYIAILPGMGLTSHLLSTFARKPIFGYNAMVYSTMAIGFFGFLVWGHHMFTSGLNPYATLAFSTLTMVVAIPSAVKTMNWLATLYRGRIQLTTPMLFSVGFVSLFVTGGLSGPILAQPDINAYLHDTYFVVAHFHMIMGMAAVFGIFAATYYWFPLMFSGILMNETLGRWHFGLTFIGAYATFMPMHFLGMAGHPRRYSQIAGSADYLQALLPLQTWVTLAAVFLITAQMIFLFNLFWSMARGKRADTNPWRSTTLEWQPQGEQPTVHHGAYEYGLTTSGSDFVIQSQAPEGTSN